MILGHITLFTIELRKAKTRRSVAMKLLHKAENVAADIFGYILPLTLGKQLKTSVRRCNP